MIYIPKELTQMMPFQHRHKPQFMQSADPAVDVKMSKNITNTRILANFTSIFHSGEQNFRPNTGGGHKKRKKIVKSLENWLVDYYITGQAVVMTTEN
jgi:hypothetical protein